MRSLLIIIIIVIIGVVGVLVYQKWGKKEESLPPEAKNNMPEEKSLQGKSIALVIAPSNFRDAEYFIPKQELENAGADITTISLETGMALGADGGEVDVNLAAAKADPQNFAAVLFIGGPGMAQQLDNAEFHKLAQDTIDKGKVLAAICIAPALLAKAGVLQAKQATVWSSPMDKSGIDMLKQGGATYQDQAVVVDGKIITANGPDSAKQFAQAVIELVSVK